MRNLKAYIAVFVMYVVLDVATTSFALGSGHAHEVSPMGVLVLDMGGTAPLIFKMVSFSLIVGATRVIGSDANMKAFENDILLFFISASAVVDISNLAEAAGWEGIASFSSAVLVGALVAYLTSGKLGIRTPRSIMVVGLAAVYCCALLLVGISLFG